MQLTTNCSFLENEILDVARLFPRRPESITHAFRYAQDGGIFYNDFVLDGEPFSFQDRGQVCNEIEWKRLERRFAKLHLYEILSRKYQTQMPWGALTGIRPTKLAYTELENGRDFRPLFEKMQVTEENIRLVEEILQTQKGIYQKSSANVDLFVSIPFCPTKCAYCSFITAPIEKTKRYIPAYLDCLDKELAAAKPSLKNLRSVYIGGGTPFAIATPELERVLKAAAQAIEGREIEYTVEAGRPDVFSAEKLSLLKAYGVNRICINPQTFSDETLKKIGRKHTVADFYNAYALSQKYGFTVNIDLIAGLADETPEEFSKGIEKALALGADNITVHCLSLKAGAKLKEEMSYIENAAISQMIASSRELLSKNGYKPYYMYRQKYQAGNNENVGWTKENKACIYNIDVMEETTDNYAVGANAISKRVFLGVGRIERMASAKDLPTYLEKIDELIAKKRKFFE